MVVASPGSAPELVALSHKSSIVARVITTDRKDFALLLDGHGEREALSGQSSVGPDRVTSHLPFDHVALVYYGSLREVYSSSNPYPWLESPGLLEQRLDCGALELETMRAGAIRWYERRSGATPFTEHQARIQHGKNAARYFANAIVAATNTAIVLGTSGVAPTVPLTGVSADALQWRVTAADRRELGLLRLKRSLSCPATPLPGTEVTDLEVLEKVEATRRALDLHEMSDEDQVKEETQLLDQFDPQA